MRKGLAIAVLLLAVLAAAAAAQARVIDEDILVAAADEAAAAADDADDARDPVVEVGTQSTDAADDADAAAAAGADVEADVDDAPSEAVFIEADDGSSVLDARESESVRSAQAALKWPLPSKDEAFAAKQAQALKPKAPVSTKDAPKFNANAEAHNSLKKQAAGPAAAKLASSGSGSADAGSGSGSAGDASAKDGKVKAKVQDFVDNTDKLWPGEPAPLFFQITTKVIESPKSHKHVHARKHRHIPSAYYGTEDKWLEPVGPYGGSHTDEDYYGEYEGYGGKK